MNFNIVEVQGTPYEMGYSFGEQCSKQILECLSYALSRQIDPGNALRCANEYQNMYQRYFPEYLEELKGTADSVGISLTESIFLQTRWNLVDKHSDQCTSFIIGSPATKGTFFAGINKDVSKEAGNHMVLLHMKPKQGPRLLIVGYYGSMAGPGINEYGVCFFGNSLYGGRPRFSYPQPVIMRMLLNQKCLDDCFKIYNYLHLNNYIGMPGNWTLCDRKQNGACIESISNMVDYIYPNRGYIVHTNHLLSKRADMREVEIENVPGNSYGRKVRFEKLLEMNYGMIDEDVLKKILSDHEGLPDSICRHGIGNECDKIITAMSYIAMPQEGGVLIAKGNPCENQYFFYDI